MSLEPSQVVQRAVDSLQKIYAVVIALAISQSIQSLIKGPTGIAQINANDIFSGIPALVAFVFTLLPFWHGMNRHLDRSYLEKTSNIAHGALILDFTAFFVEAVFLFAAAWSLRSGLTTFVCLGALLFVDMIWGGISHLIHSRGNPSHSLKWSAINVVALGIACLVIFYPPVARPEVLMIVAVLRTIADYILCFEFYFPPVGAATSANTAQSAAQN